MWNPINNYVKPNNNHNNHNEQLLGGDGTIDDCDNRCRETINHGANYNYDTNYNNNRSSTT